MLFSEITREVIDDLRQKYPKGTRVRLLRMDDTYTKLVPGNEGTVSAVDDIGTIHVDWDNGSSLGVAYGVDLCEKI